MEQDICPDCGLPRAHVGVGEGEQQALDKTYAEDQDEPQIGSIIGGVAGGFAGYATTRYGLDYETSLARFIGTVLGISVGSGLGWAIERKASK